MLGTKVAFGKAVRSLTPGFTPVAVFVISTTCDEVACSKSVAPTYHLGVLNDSVGPIAKATFEAHRRSEVLL